MSSRPKRTAAEQRRRDMEASRLRMERRLKRRMREMEEAGTPMSTTILPIETVLAQLGGNHNAEQEPSPEGRSGDR